MASIGTRTDNESRNNIRTIDFQQVVKDPSFPGPFGNTVGVPFSIAQSFSRSEASLVDLYLYYSWYNISAVFGNNVFQYAFPTNVGGYQTFTVTVPDGFYSIDELSDYFQQAQINNGTYLYLTADPGQTPITYLSWGANSIYYRTTLFSTPVPNATDTDYTAPANFPGGSGNRSLTSQDPSLIVLPSTAPAGSNTPGQYSFSKTLGFSPGTYPPLGTTTTYSVNGQFAPVIESTSTVNVAVSFINNGGITTNPTILHTFSPTVGFGDQIVVQTRFPNYLPIADGVYQGITVQLQDENFQPLNLQDPHINGRIICRGRG